jgi:flavin reductase (DIM6/NTAB) family NADH-FMN oxidoreductase RutF
VSIRNDPSLVSALHSTAIKMKKMNAPMLHIDPRAHAARDVYKLMTGLIVPRPIALVSTVDSAGAANVAPFSFFCGVGSVPPTLLFCPALHRAHPDPALRKDTLRNVEETGEFVVNVVSEAIAEAANLSAADVPSDVDEFALAGLTPLASEVVRPPRVAESPAHMECKLLQVIYTSREPGAGVIVLGEIVRFHVREELSENFRVDPEGLDAVGRMAGNTWVRTRDRIELIRPK